MRNTVESATKINEYTEKSTTGATQIFLDNSLYRSLNNFCEIPPVIHREQNFPQSVVNIVINTLLILLINEILR